MKKTYNKIKSLAIICSLTFSLNGISQTTPTNTLSTTQIIGSATVDSMFIAKDTIVAKKDVRVVGDLKVKGDVKLKDKLKVDNLATFNGLIKANAGIDLGSSFGMKTGITDINGNNFMQVGKTFGGSILPPPIVCPGSASNMWWMSNYGGYISQASQGSMNASLSMWTDWINGNGHIEAQGTNNIGTANALLINYFCGRDVGINNGPNGGNVSLGGSSNHGVFMYSPTKIRTYDINAFRIENPNNNKTTFYVSTAGRTIIGEQTQTTGSHNNAILTINGKAVAKEIIVTQQNWADYVFAKNYSLMNLDKLEAYINTNKHLPNVPSAKEIDKDGLNLGEINKIQMEKIEELTLYVIELKKEINQLKSKEADKK